MLIKPHPDIDIRDIEAMLFPYFVLDRASDGVYDLNVSGTAIKRCAECGKPHCNTGLALCESCNHKLEREARSIKDAANF